MSNDDSERRVLSRKELAKEQRREAYQKAKQQRASDPRHLAMKEAVKTQRRAAYQKLKQGRATDTAAKKSKLNERRAADHNEQLSATEARIAQVTQRALQSTTPPTQGRENLAPAQERSGFSDVRAAGNSAALTTADRLAAESAPELCGYIAWGKRSDVLN